MPCCLAYSLLVSRLFSSRAFYIHFSGGLLKRALMLSSAVLGMRICTANNKSQRYEVWFERYRGVSPQDLGILGIKDKRVKLSI